MSARIRFEDARVRDDLATYFGRAGRIEDGSVLVEQIGSAVAFWVPVLRPAGILDRSPLTVGVRAIAGEVLDADSSDCASGRFEAVVPLRGFLDRLAREVSGDAALELSVPPERRLESWTGRRPPLHGWTLVGQLDAAAVLAAAEAGIAAVANSADQQAGRTDTWTRELPDSCGALVGDTRPPAGVAFAGHALGFWRVGDPIAVHIADGWWRLVSRTGQILAQR